MVVRHAIAGGVVLLALVTGCTPVTSAEDGTAPPVDGIVRADGAVAGNGQAAVRTAADEGGTGDAGTDVQEIPVVVDEAPAQADVDADVLADDPESLGVVDAAQPLVVDAVADDLVVSPVVETDGFQTVGVSWPAGADATTIDPQVRTRDAGGDWSDWVPLAVADEQPDAGTTDAANGVRGGTDSVWVGQADAVQLAFDADSTVPAEDVRLALVSSDLEPEGTAPVRDASSDGDAVITTAALRTASSALAAPRVVSRAEWGAAAPVCAPDVASTLVGAVVHHTAGSNSYSTVEQAMQQIRNDQAYHIGTRGWCDIGYNFIVDKWGNIYEGRANSLTQPVIGVHAGGFNTATVGVSMLGDFSTVTPSDAMQESVAQIIGYRLGVYGRNPSGMMSYTTGGGENSRFAAGAVVSLPVVFGHRDTAFTACPGNQGYATLGAIRVRAARIAFSQPIVSALYHDMLQRDVDPTGLATWTAQLMAGVPAASLGDSIAHSVEYVQRRVADAYMEILGRGPDPTGMATWTQQITSGRLRVEDLRGTLIQSDEYYGLAGGTNAGYIQRLYQDILSRDPGQQEIAYWSAQVGVRGRAAAPNGIWRSLESAQLRVHEAFQTYLDRPADPNGLGTWGPYWQANGEDALRAMVIGSDEYLGRSVRRFA